MSLSRGFDFIVIGAGSAGCVLANRLSAQLDKTVLLIEAGGSDRSVLIRVPGMVERVIRSRRYNWHYAGEPDASLGGRSLVWAGGKVLGGSSSINGMVFVRGLRGDFDGWASAGHAGWGYADLLPYFRRMETWRGVPSDSRGVDGPLNVAPFAEPNAACLAWRDAAVAAGVPALADYNAGITHGVGVTQASQLGGRRHSAADAFLRPALRRGNLVVASGSLATRLLVRNGRCHGVECVRDGGVVQVEALREVVVACGAIGSPALLMRSGIGPPAVLRESGIAVVHALEGVGRNLNEHVNVRMTLRTVGRTYSNAGRGLAGAWNGLRWLARGDGPVASPAGHVQTFLKTDPGLDAADVQVQAMPLSFDLSDRSEAMTLVVSLCRPAARGAVRLLGTGVAVEIGLLPDADTAALVRGCRLVREICAGVPGVEAVPGVSVRSDADWLGFIRGIAGLNWHPAGTCRMGDVLGTDLLLRGVAGVSVADGSVMPWVTSGNTNAPVLAIGERAGDLVLGRVG